MRYNHLVISALVGMAPAIGAQEMRAGPEIRPFVGAYVPAGAIKEQFKSAVLLGLQAAYEPARHFHVLGTVSWMNGRSRLSGFDDDATSIWQYDAGVEFHLVRALSEWQFQPFVGAGAGARTYDYRASNVTTTTCTAGYASTGAQLQRGALAWRLEGRGYLSCYESPLSDKSVVRNDYAIMLGAVWQLR